MSVHLVQLALGLVVLASLGRVGGILITKVRQAGYAKRAVALPRSWRDVCTVPEPYLLGITTLALSLGHRVPAEPSAALVARAGGGALLAAAGIALMLWAVRSFPSVSTGHYILPEHAVVTRGAYAWVRHPLYLAAFLIWLAVSLAFGSVAALAFLLVYVIPGYWIYLKSEEETLVENLGDAYRRYQQRVGRLFPRIRSSAT